MGFIDPESIRDFRLLGSALTMIRSSENISIWLLSDAEIIQEYRDSQILTRSAADGQRFWNYDVRDREYTSSPYATAGFVGNEKDRLYQNLVLRSKGAQNLLAHLMRDTYTGDLSSRRGRRTYRE